jgi:aryl-alcohol dehydrogenase-like predicted oxidoreductase
MGWHPLGVGDLHLPHRVQQLAPLAEAEGLTMAPPAIAWMLQTDDVAAAMTGASWPDQVTADAQAAEHRLSVDTLAGIGEVLPADTAPREVGPAGATAPVAGAAAAIVSG